MSPARRGWSAAVLAVALAAPLVLAGLGRAPFDDPGEGMHAQIARELRGGGDPLALTLNGVRYADKPPLLYLLVAAAFGVAGESEGAARAVPALAGLGAVGVTAWLGGRLLGLGAGVLAGVALLTSPGFFAYARYVRPETLFVAALAAGFALALTGLREARPRLVMAGFAAFGLAGLAKDPLGALLPPLLIGAALALGGRARPVRRWLPWPGVALALAGGLGWWVLAEMRTPGTLWYMAVDNHALNVARARVFPDEDVPLGAAAFLTVGALGAFPWVIGAAVAVTALVRRRAWRDPAEMPWTALGLWALAVFAGTALSPFRLPHYGLPAYPAIALLAARAWRGEGARRLLGVHAAILGALAVAAAVVWVADGGRVMESVLGATDVASRKSAAAGQAPAVPSWEVFRPLVGLAAVALAAGSLAAAVVWWARRRGGDGRGPGLGGGAVVAVTMLALLPMVGRALEAVASHRAVRGVAREVAARAGAADMIAHEGPLENSGAFEWYAARRPLIVDGRRSVLGFGATQAASAEVFLDAVGLRRAWESGARVWVLTVRAPERSLLGTLPGARLVMAGGGRWLYVNR